MTRVNLDDLRGPVVMHSFIQCVLSFLSVMSNVLFPGETVMDRSAILLTLDIQAMDNQL